MHARKNTAAVAVLLGALAATTAIGCSSSDDGGGGPCGASTSEALKVCSTAATLKGVDVSTYQGTVSWTSVKAAGNKFALTRVSDGLTHLDGTFATNWSHIKSAGLVRGAYQFFRPGSDPIQQADLMISKINAAGGLLPGDIAPVLDVEVTDGMSAATIQSRAKAWLAHVQQVTGRKPIVYTAAFMSTYIGTALGAYPLWVANYGTSCPTMPSGWSDWKMWQSSSTGSVSGISGNVDVDQFKGTLADLMAFADAQPTQPTSPADAGSGGGTKGDAGTVVDPGSDPTGGDGASGAASVYGGNVVGGADGAAMGDGFHTNAPASAGPPATGECN
jgi:lysozyme